MEYFRKQQVAFEVLEALNADPVYRKITTLILTNYDETENEIRGLDLGAVDYIRKPLNIESLRKRIEVRMSLRSARKSIEQHNEILEEITQAACSMLGIINDILDFSKIEAGKVELERISFSLHKVVQHVVNILAIKVEEQQIGFNLRKDPKLPVNFFGDPKRLEQIMIIIINNAVKFTSEGQFLLRYALPVRRMPSIT